jgi:hypothetical protein
MFPIHIPLIFFNIPLKYLSKPNFYVRACHPSCGIITALHFGHVKQVSAGSALHPAAAIICNLNLPAGRWGFRPIPPKICSERVT